MLCRKFNKKRSPQSPFHWLAGIARFGYRKWKRYHEWYPSCPALFRRLTALERGERRRKRNGVEKHDL